MGKLCAADAALGENDLPWFEDTGNWECVICLFHSVICLSPVLVAVRWNPARGQGQLRPALRPPSMRRWLGWSQPARDWALHFWRRRLLSTKTALWRNPALKTITRPPAGPGGGLRNERFDPHQLDGCVLLQSEHLVVLIKCSFSYTLLIFVD